MERYEKRFAEDLDTISARTKKLADNYVRDLENVLKVGFDSVYSDIQEVLGDMEANLPWDFNESVKAIEYILSSPKFLKINKPFLKKYGVDMKKEFEYFLKHGDYKY